MSDKKDINYTHNDGAKFRYSASRDKKSDAPKTEKVKEALTKRAELWKTNKALAALILVAVVILSSAVSIWRTAHSREAEVEKYYGDVSQNVAKVISSAKFFARYSDVSSSPAVDRLFDETRELIKELEVEADAPYRKQSDVERELYEHGERIYYLLTHGEAAPDVDSDEELVLKSYYDDLYSSYRMLGSSEKYNEAAKEYNKTMSRFPMSVLGKERAAEYERFDDYVQDAQDDDGGNVLSDVVSTVISAVRSLSIFQIGAIVIVIIAVVGYFTGRGKRRG